MKFSVFERMIILNILPREGDLLTLRILRELRNAMSFSDTELKELEFQQSWRCDKCNLEEPRPSSTVQAAEKCSQCDGDMTNTGRMYWKQEADREKDIKLGAGSKKRQIIVDQFKELSKQNKLDIDQHLPIAERLLSKEDWKEIEEEAEKEKKE